MNTSFKKPLEIVKFYCKSHNNPELLKQKKEYLKFLRSHNLDENSIVAALLYDIDNGAKFGDEVSQLISGLRKFDELATKAKRRNNEEKIRKMLIATTSDLRILVAKLLERLYLMRKLSALDDTQRKLISKETLDVYTPISYRLGLSDIKWELEDLSFKYLTLDEYKIIKEKVRIKRKEREKIVNVLKKELGKSLKKNRIEGEIFGRPKHFYSIYRKMINKEKKFEGIHDIIGLRVIVENSGDCYAVLGVVGNLWNLIPERLKDFIVTPKDNLYQSLHTGFLYNEIPVEIQIRTRKMNEIAEEGIAAHWKYKGLVDNKFNKQLSWLRQILSFANENDKEFLYKLKLDIFGDRIFCFTPKGDIIELEERSSVVDFAYAVHSDIGDKCIGAKVNGKFVGVRSLLKNGDEVEILTSKIHKPSRDWLGFVRTSKALERIRGSLQIKQSTHNRVVLEKEKHGSFIAADGGYNIRIAKCCNPLPNDEIVGSLSSFRNVIVHSGKCKNVPGIKKFVNVFWTDDFSGAVNIIILADDRLGLFAEILNSVASLGISTKSAKANSAGNEIAECTLNIELNSLKDLKNLVERIGKINRVRKIRIE